MTEDTSETNDLHTHRKVTVSDAVALEFSGQGRGSVAAKALKEAASEGRDDSNEETLESLSKRGASLDFLDTWVELYPEQARNAGMSHGMITHALMNKAPTLLSWILEHALVVEGMPNTLDLFLESLGDQEGQIITTEKYKPLVELVAYGLVDCTRDITDAIKMTATCGDTAHDISSPNQCYLAFSKRANEYYSQLTPDNIQSMPSSMLNMYYLGDALEWVCTPELWNGKIDKLYAHTQNVPPHVAEEIWEYMGDELQAYEQTLVSTSGHAVSGPFELGEPVEAGTNASKGRSS